jgi:ABC-type molybdenum transport system ATPase subunit/photorepair protein PhrA
MDGHQPCTGSRIQEVAVRAIGGSTSMIQTNGISLRYGDKKLFEDVNVKFTAGNCYGVIGANGAAKPHSSRSFRERWSPMRAMCP